MMNADRPLNLLFAAYMAGGNGTILRNLEETISPRPDVVSRWLPVELNPKKLIRYGTKQVSIIPGTIENSLVTARGIRRFEKEGISFDAAFFFQHTICMGLFGFRRRVPYVIAMDGTPLFYARNNLWYAHPYFNPASMAAKIKHTITRDVYRNAYHLMPLSSAVRDSLIDDYDIDPAKITVVPPGINLKKFAWHERLESTRDSKPFTVLFIGADFIRKGGDLLASIARQPEFRDIRFDFITRTYEGPRTPNIIVHDNISANTEPMLRLLREADIFVLPTRADSFSIASLEAMASGLPVITSPVGGIRDIIIHGSTGYLLPVNDQSAVAEHIRCLRDNQDLRSSMGKAARKRVESSFNIETISNTVVEVLRKSVSEN